MKLKNNPIDNSNDEMSEALKFLKRKKLENSALKKLLDFLEKERNMRLARNENRY